MAFTSKYEAQIEKYDQESQQQNFGGGDFNLNFISITKKEPKVYIQVLAPKLIPVPMYSFVECPDGKKRSFIDRSFVGKEDVIKGLGLKTPWGPLKPTRTCIAVAAQWTRNENHRYVPIREDVRVDAQRAEDVLSRHPKWRKKVVPGADGSDGPEDYTFPDVPRVGIFQANRMVDQQLATMAAEFGSLDNELFAVKRTGEGTNTRYTAMNIKELPSPDDEEFPEDLQIAVELHATIDEYIDTFISDDRYRSAGLLPSDGDDSPKSPTKTQTSEDEDPDEAQSRSRRRDSEPDDDDDEDDSEELAAFIKSKYGA